MLELYDVFEDEENDCFQVRTKGDIILIEFEDDRKKEIFSKISNNFRNGSRKKFNDLYNRLKKEHQEGDVLEVLVKLNDYQLLNTDYEKALQKLTNSEKSKEENPIAGQTRKNFWFKGSATLGIVKSGLIADKIKDLASKATFSKIDTMDIHNNLDEKKIKKFVEQHDLIVFDSDSWNPALLDLVNEEALRHDKPWLLIRGFAGNEGSIGPIFWGRRTGCYNCLISRLKSNMQHLSYFKSYEKFLREQRISSKSDSPPEYFYDVIASMAIFELNKFIYNWDIPQVYGAMIDVDFSLNVTKHTLLKSPLCDVCKPTTDYNLSPWLESITLK
ncbi:MAG: TOMM precursor leader peptide-binding protein [Bacteroidota bacterium]